MLNANVIWVGSKDVQFRLSGSVDSATYAVAAAQRCQLGQWAGPTGPGSFVSPAKYSLTWRTNFVGKHCACAGWRPPLPALLSLYKTEIYIFAHLNRWEFALFAKLQFLAVAKETENCKSQFAKRSLSIQENIWPISYWVYWVAC